MVHGLVCGVESGFVFKAHRLFVSGLIVIKKKRRLRVDRWRSGCRDASYPPKQSASGIPA